MFKRFLVIDMFHGQNANKEVSEWIDCRDGSPVKMPRDSNGLYKVKLNNGDQTVAYYCSDGLVNLVKSADLKPSKWWHKTTQKPLDNVTHWGMPKEST